MNNPFSISMSHQVIMDETEICVPAMAGGAHFDVVFHASVKAKAEETIIAFLNEVFDLTILENPESLSQNIFSQVAVQGDWVKRVEKRADVVVHERLRLMATG